MAGDQVILEGTFVDGAVRPREFTFAISLIGFPIAVVRRTILESHLAFSLPAIVLVLSLVHHAVFFPGEFARTVSFFVSP